MTFGEVMGVVNVVGRAARWLHARRVGLKLDLSFATGPGDTQIVTVTATNTGGSALVLEDLGVARCSRQGDGRPYPLAIRTDNFRNGQRLELWDRHEFRLDLSLLPPDHLDHPQAPLKLWGYAKVTRSATPVLSPKPLSVRDMRSGSATAGETIYP